jgi:hypothetical protein
MRFAAISLLITTVFVQLGCSLQDSRSVNEIVTKEKMVERVMPASAPSQAYNDESRRAEVSLQKVSLDTTDKTKVVSEAMDRKIIRNADIALESADPNDGLRRISSIAENYGGFVVTSDATHLNARDDLKPQTTITITVRVPSAKFSAVIEEVRKVGNQVTREKITGQDVTEEYIDLEARIKTQKALEAQFLEIMKQANNVTSALEVQKQIAEVRTEIERLEGRRRYLDNQSSLSTINITLQTPMQIVSSSGFYNSIKSAFSDGVDIAAGITLFFIRFIITLLPIALFIFLPIGILIQYLRKRARKRQLAKELAAEPLTEVR